MKTTLTRRAFVTLGGSLGAAMLAGCKGAGEQPASDANTEADASTEAAGIDYMALVNKQHKLPDNWEDEIEIVSFKNSEDWNVDVEVKAYDAYLALKDDLEKDGIYVDLDSAYRSVAEQQRIVDDFTEEYGEEYVKLYVAVPGYSEHHTGLALDLFLIIDGKGVYLNEDSIPAMGALKIPAIPAAAQDFHRLQLRALAHSLPRRSRSGTSDRRCRPDARGVSGRGRPSGGWVRD